MFFINMHKEKHLRFWGFHPVSLPWYTITFESEIINTQTKKNETFKTFNSVPASLHSTAGPRQHKSTGKPK